MSAEAREVVERMLDVGRAQDAEAFVALMAPDGYIEWPFCPPGAPERLEGREAIRAFLTQVARAPIRFDEYRDVVVHETADPEVIIVEYQVYGHLTTSGGPFRQTVIAVLRVRDGLVISYRDYINPLPLMAALGH
ncbi:nuclear transport factor 2 family protein [Dactylosporangium sp. NPDC051485]|uniref:nuclear transport factor 2 family protein n=1 Tax=Dactylosporangium sp. NPDC051485 TaxID=3154846 RepID=UPI00341A94CB